MVSKEQGILISPEDCRTIFNHVFRKISAHHHYVNVWIDAEINSSGTEEQLNSNADSVASESKIRFMNAVMNWAQVLLNDTWIVCMGKESEKECPTIDEYSDTSMRGLHPLPDEDNLKSIFNTILLLHLTTTKQYSARSRTILSSFVQLDEADVVNILKDPERAKQVAEEHMTAVKDAEANRNSIWRTVGVGVSAVAGGVLVGVTGGLAAPLVGAGLSAVLGFIGVGGTVAGVIASGLASSSVVCAALFGAYGAKSSAEMMSRHTREINDFAFIPVRPVKDTLGVRICVSGWLSSPSDVKAPWTIFGGDDTFALQWEMEALGKLSTALSDLVKSHTMKYVKAEIVKRTVLASLMSSLAPIAWLKLGQIIDNPWMNARALAIKAGKVLGTLLSEGAFGKRPITLTGYSLGALVIVEALKYLASLPTEKTIDMIQDIYLFGTPVATDAKTWTSIRRLVAGRVVNGYSNDDYVLAVLSRASEASWRVAGLHPVDVMGIENVLCSHVEGHIQWRGAIGRCLRDCKASGIIDEEVELQVVNVEEPIREELQKNILEKEPEEQAVVEI